MSHHKIGILLLLGLLSQTPTSLATSCKFTLSEEARPNLPLGRVFSGILPGKVPYQQNVSLIPVKDWWSRYFRVNKFTGVLHAIKRIDRDSLCSDIAECCDASKSCNLYFIIMIRGRYGSVTNKTCVVRIIDKNDNAPTFPVRELQVEVFENQRIGKSIFSLQPAIDRDSQQNAMLRYVIQTPNTPFRITTVSDKGNAVVNVLKLTKPLDREKQDRYHLTVAAIDGGSSPLTGTVKIRVRVIDVNDNSPRFLQSFYVAKVSENRPPGTFILRVSATDADAGQNAVITYGFHRSVAPKLRTIFFINSNTGHIYLRRSLDAEKQSSFQLRVTASDPTLQSTAEVRIHVMDENDNRPEIRIRSFTRGNKNGSELISVRENAHSGLPVAIITAVDKDVSKRNSLVTCALRESEVHSFQAFTLVANPRSGLPNNSFTMIAIRTLDRELTPNLFLRIICRDSGFVFRIASMRIIVRVLDENDNSPRLRLSGNTNVSEMQPAGTPVLRVLATDPDEGLNGQVLFTMEESSETAKQLFQISNITGTVSTRIKIIREGWDSPFPEKVPIIVTAKDRGKISRSTSIRFEIDIVRAKDNLQTTGQSPTIDRLTTPSINKQTSQSFEEKVFAQLDRMEKQTLDIKKMLKLMARLNGYKILDDFV